MELIKDDRRQTQYLNFESEQKQFNSELQNQEEEARQLGKLVHLASSLRMFLILGHAFLDDRQYINLPTFGRDIMKACRKHGIDYDESAQDLIEKIESVTEEIKIKLEDDK